MVQNGDNTSPFYALRFVLCDRSRVSVNKLSKSQNTQTCTVRIGNFMKLEACSVFSTELKFGGKVSLRCLFKAIIQV